MDISKFEYNELQEDIVKVLIQKTQNETPHMFRLMTLYHMSVLASLMRVSIKSNDIGTIPINNYILNLAVSGAGKNYSNNVLEDDLFVDAYKKYLQTIFKEISDNHLQTVAIKVAQKEGIDPQEALDIVTSDFKELGEYILSFDSATVPAVKQMRQKLLMANSGAINIYIDEIGDNFLQSKDVLTTFLELYDVGKLKQKLIKNTKDSKRVFDLMGRTPANMLLFGTPVKLLDGAKVEESFFGFLKSGYARRFLFGLNRTVNKNTDITGEELYQRLIKLKNLNTFRTIRDKLSSLITLKNHGKIITMPKELSIRLLDYKILCERKAADLKEHQELEKTELAHRYYKTLKTTGAYAFISGSDTVKPEHLEAAIKLVEDSGREFKNTINSEPNFSKLAKYLVDIGTEQTAVDLIEELPFFRGSELQRKELINKAIAYGYKNNIYITKFEMENITFYSAKQLTPTSLDSLILSYSSDITENYKSTSAPFNKLYKLVTKKGLRFTNHFFKNGYRKQDNVIQGFNTIILDIDGTSTISTTKELLNEYTWLLYTTKSHLINDKEHFRIILPLTHKLTLNAKDFSEFMANVFNWLPFEVDKACKDISRSWACYNNSQYTYNTTDKLLDAFMFIPNTSKNRLLKDKINNIEDLNNLERWFVLNSSSNRNNNLIKYGFILMDQGLQLIDIEKAIYDLNQRFPNPLKKSEIQSTVLKTIANKIAN